MKSKIQLVLILLILVSITTTCQKQSKYDEEVKVEYTPYHINLIRPIIDPERIYQMSLDEKRFVHLPAEMKKMKNLRELHLTDLKVKDWEKSADAINSFKKLNTLFINYNHFDELPFRPQKLPNLEELYLSYSDNFKFEKAINKLIRLEKLKELGLAGINMDSIPENFLDLESLERVQIGEHQKFNYNQGLETISKLPKLERLDIIYSNLKPYPKNLEKLKKLKGLEIYHCQVDLEKVFSTISVWENLKILNLGDMNIETLPEKIRELKNLKTLKLHDNRNLNQQKLFRQLAEIPGLEELVISETILHHQHDRFVMPEELAELKKLKRLDMATSQNIVFDSLFDVLVQLPKLEYLNLHDNGSTGHITQFPDKLYKFKNLKELIVSFSGPHPLDKVTKMPPGLEKLDYSRARFSERSPMQKVIFTATSLKSLNLNTCRLKELPEEIGNLKNLVHLDLGNNQLKDLPESITKLKKLRYLNLMGTHISESEEKRKEIEQMLPNTLIFFGEYEAYEPI